MKAKRQKRMPSNPGLADDSQSSDADIIDFLTCNTCDMVFLDRDTGREHEEQCMLVNPIEILGRKVFDDRVALFRCTLDFQSREGEVIDEVLCVYQMKMNCVTN